MTSRPIWMPLYVADYIADTRHLTTLQHGAYLLLIMEYWQKGRLPADDKKLQIICSMSPWLWRRNKAALAALFDRDWRHRRIDEELKKAFELRLKRSVYGSRGGRAKHSKRAREAANVLHWDTTKR
jgi:uncharacterized protein YdaU (DUF1376 family)